jgi:VWFA-related protein
MKTVSIVRTLCAIAATSSAVGVVALAQGTDRTAWVQTVVTDAQGQLVTSLGQSDFRLIADEREQPITVFSKNELPMALSLMLDVSGSLKKHRHRVRDAARLIVDEFGRGDRVNIGAFDGAVQVTERFTASPRRIFWSLDQPVTGADTPCGPPTTKPLQANLRNQQPVSEPWIGRGGTALWDAVFCGVRELQRDRESIRKVMVLVTDGMENSSQTARDFAVRYAQTVGVMIYTVGFYGTDGAPNGLNAGLLRKLSLETGGRFFDLEDKDPLEPVFARIGEELRAHYVLGFERQSSGATRKLLVEAKTAGLTARARTRF